MIRVFEVTGTDTTSFMNHFHVEYFVDLVCLENGVAEAGGGLSGAVKKKTKSTTASGCTRYNPEKDKSSKKT